MYNTVILKLHTATHFESKIPCAVYNSWSSTRKINFFAKCKELLNAKECKRSVKEEASNDKCSSSPGTVEEHRCSPAVHRNSQYSANVVVIGAGMAGLSAANHLQDNGINNVTVLEANNRPGGRIHSIWFEDSIIELGSPINKKPKNNPIMRSVYEDGLSNPPMNQADPSRGLLQRSDGSVIPFPISFKIYEVFKRIWAESLKYEQSGYSKTSKMSFISRRIMQEIRMLDCCSQDDATRLFHGFASMVSARSNHDDSLITCDSFGNYIQLPSSNIKVPLGHFGEINKLYEALSPEQVLFNKKVTKIKWGGVGDVFPRAVVVCDDGDEFKADYVIITLPLGVLKAFVNTLFCPGLPATKLDVILKIPNGYANKIFLQFPKPFWVWNKNIKKMTFDAKTMECKEGWLKGISSIEPIRGSSNVLCVTVAGLHAQVLECTTNEEVICNITELLKEFSPNVPKPAKIKRTRWSSDDKFYGAYSYLGPGISSKDFYSLASPLPEQSDECDPVLLFAGEATCPVQFGTVNGAKASGIREAERLLQLVRLRRNKDEYEEDTRQTIRCNL